MQTEDKYLLVSVIFAVVVGGGIFLYRPPAHSAPMQAFVEQGVVAQSLPSDVTPSVLLGPNYQQDKSLRRPYVVVEFGDYQCPPCAALHVRLKTFVEANSKQVGLAFRQYPLVQIHPNAFGAALYAEAAREQGKFWQMHNLLYDATEGLEPLSLDKYARTLHLDMNALHQAIETTAKKRVRADMDAAFDLKVDSTPTLILCEQSAKPRIVTFEELEKSVR